MKHTAETLLDYIRQNWPDMVTLTTELMMRVYRLNDLVRENARRKTEQSGPSCTEFEVLVALRGVNPPHELIPTDLYQLVLLSSGGLTKVLRGLDERGLITRGRAETDRRSKPVCLTAAGKALAERVMPEVLESDGELLTRGLSAAEMDRLIKLVAKLLGALETTRSGT